MAAPTTERRCRECGSDDDLCRHRRMLGGVDTICRPCQRERNRRRREPERERMRRRRVARSNDLAYREAERERHKRYARENPGKMAELDARKRARKAGVPSEPYTREQVFARGLGHCWCCGRPVTLDTMHVDHLEPISKGGPDVLANLAPACAACNVGRGVGRSLDWHLARWDEARAVVGSIEQPQRP